MRKRRIVAGITALLVGGIYLNNASWLAPAPVGGPVVLAHRGVHQTFSERGLTDSTCTATRIDPPHNAYLENTIPSMRASFAAGAGMVELEVHPTIDGEFAVFHDWTLDCRTNGHGVTREQSMAYLRTLDVGYGYTADGGRTHPFRGRGVGLMPTLDEAMAAFPGRRFLVNIKSNDPDEVDRLLRYLAAHHRPIDGRLWVFADGRPVERLRRLAPRAVVMSGARFKACTLGYLALGWSGYVPAACRHGALAVPVNLRRLYWGWPDRLFARMEGADSHVVLMGPARRGRPGGLTDATQLDGLPADFPALVMTDDVERIGPAVRRRWR